MNKKEVLEEMQYQIEKGNVLSDSLKLRIKTIKRRRKQESAKRRLLQQRIDKAIELIKNECLDEDGHYCCDLWGDDIYKLLSILRGEEE